MLIQTAFPAMTPNKKSDKDAISITAISQPGPARLPATTSPRRIQIGANRNSIPISKTNGSFHGGSEEGGGLKA
jgi:hypothetical protein